MEDNSKLERQLIRHEGLRLKPYRCSSGKLTIGVGRNLEDNGITRTEALNMLERDIEEARFDVETVLDVYKIPPWKINETRKDALANLAFNMGRRSLVQFRKMFMAIKADDWHEAAAELLNSRYAKQVGGRASEIANQICSGRYQDEKGAA